MSKNIISPTLFAVDYTTRRTVEVAPVDPGWADRAMEASVAVFEALASPSSSSGDFACGWSATTAVVFVVVALVVAFMVAIGTAVHFRRRALEAEAFSTSSR